jgi:hypothetical protein
MWTGAILSEVIAPVEVFGASKHLPLDGGKEIAHIELIRKEKPTRVGV